MATFKVADASEYIAITGWGIDDVKLAKKAWVWIGQQCKKFDITPVNYEFEVHAMSSEKLPFVLPAVFTIGPKISDDDSKASLLLYAKLIAPHDKNSSHVRELVKGVIEGETRVLAASMTMEEIFQGTKSFKQAVFENVQLELKQFGLYIYNANVKQLVDVPGQEYFSYLGQKTQQGAMNQAKVDVAEARMKGAVGAKEREGTTLQKAAEVDSQTKVFKVRQEAIGIKEQAKVEAEVKVFENEREAVVAAAKAELATKKAAWDRQIKVAEVEAAKAVAIREAELQMEVERKNALRQTEKLKAEQLSKATVQYDTQVQDSNAALYSRQKAAEAKLYEQQRAAEARKAQADAQFFEQKLAEDAKLYAKQKEAESLAMVGKAKAEYVSSMLQALGGNYNALRDYLMIDGGLYQEMARINAGAVSGMQPKISIWSNGGADGGSASNVSESGASTGVGALQQVAGVYKMLPPLLSTVHEQTGMLPPAWMGALPKDGDAN
ncbi:flotillin-like protein 2 [Phragmites australis]|uniref:flotillin-like protein 2 n=1 Tax=Phragmites australis TaxID=29695 RepID=UPI002D76A4F4|nr:flotillin-like protein 2 [Phragmites australis]